MDRLSRLVVFFVPMMVLLLRQNPQAMDNSIFSQTISPDIVDGKYQRDVKKTWEINTGEFLNFTINVTKMLIEESSNCKADKLEIRNFRDTRMVMEPLCSKWPEDKFLVRSVLEYGLLVRFTSDKSHEYEGFVLEITGEPPDVETVCSMMHDGEKKTISSVLKGVKSRYPADLNCSWPLTSQSGSSLKLTVEYLDIEYSGPNCSFDRLEIQEEGKETLRLCGRQGQRILTTSSQQVILSFVSDSGENTRGFEVSYGDAGTTSGETNVNGPFLATPQLKHMYLQADHLEAGQTQVWMFQTHPGYIIKMYSGKPFDDAVSFYDGPDSTFERLSATADSKEVLSKGFYLAVRLELPSDSSWIASNISFLAVLDVNVHNTSIIYNGEQDFYYDKNGLNPRVMYASLFVDIEHFIRVSLRSKIEILRNSPNIDNCALVGFVLYDSSVRYENMLGPFCGLADEYVQHTLSKIVGSSHIMYAVLYDYTEANQQWQIDWLRATPSNCPGYQVSEATFEEQKILRTQNFNMSATLEGEVNVLRIWIHEGNFTCAVIMIMPTQQARKAVDVVLSGPLEYRICYRWNIVNYNLPYSKYKSSESCTGPKTVMLGQTSRVGVVPRNTGWSRSQFWLEIGDVQRDICYDLPMCEDESQTNWTCGVIRSVTDGCRWHLTMPSTHNGFWTLTLNLLNSSKSENDAHITLREASSDVVMETILKYWEIGELRPFLFETRRNINLSISFMNVGEISLRFEYKTYSGSQVTPEENCSMFEGHCYKLVQHEAALSWDRASAVCQGDGGELVSINSERELRYLKQQLADRWLQHKHYYSSLIFIGLKNAKDTVKGTSYRYRWSDGSPLSVTDWYYPFAPFDNVLGIAKYESQHVDANSTTEGKIQPIPDLSHLCTGMVPTNLFFSTNWIKLNCTFLQDSRHLFSICEYTNESVSLEEQKLYFTETATHVPDWTCEPNWTLFHNTCLSVLTADIPRSRYLESGEGARNLCSAYHPDHGRLAQLTTVPRTTLLGYLAAIGMNKSLSGLWVALETAAEGCVSLGILRSANLYAEYLTQEDKTCNLMTIRPSNVLCETQPIRFKRECEDYQFRCKDGSCLTPDLVCDDNQDCSNGDDEMNCPDMDITFKCRDGKTLSVSKKCDFHVDCPDRSDERDCYMRPCDTNTEYECYNKECVPKEFRCDGKKDCLDASDEKACDLGTECKNFMCPLVGCVPNIHVNDLQVDCPDRTQDDELESLERHQSQAFFVGMNRSQRLKNDCPGKVDHQRCHTDHVKCFSRSNSCMYDHDEYGKLKYCRNGAHLKHCEDFPCPGMFKCNASYCIPRHKLCNGVKDCIQGEDEVDCNPGDYFCESELRCNKSSVCIPRENICDGLKHCPDGDDEKFCDMKGSTCHPKCTCLGYSVKCANQLLVEIPPMKFYANIRILNFTGNRLDISNSTLKGFFQLRKLQLQHNRISALQAMTFKDQQNLQELDLRNNKIRVLEEDVFKGLTRLKTLHITGNPLTTLVSDSFSSLKSLKELVLTGMSINSLPDDVFAEMTSLMSLRLSDNSIEAIEPNALSTIPNALERLFLDGNPLESTTGESFYNANCKHLVTDSYRFCCYVGDRVGDCKPTSDVFSSCNDLLADDLLQMAVWIYAILITVGNLAVLAWHGYVKLADASSIFVVNLSISHLLMATCFWTLGIADIHYRGDFIHHEMQWRRSVVCHSIGVVATIASHKALFSLVCLAIDKAKRLTNSGEQITNRTAWVVDGVGWAICLMTSLLPLGLAGHFDSTFYSKNTICLPYNFDNPKGHGWEEATAVFAILTILGLCIITAMSIFMSCKGDQYKEDDIVVFNVEIDMLRRCSNIVKTDVFVMCIILLANLLSLIGEPFSHEIGSLLEVTFLPLAAAANPYIYLLNACQSKRIAKYRAKHG